jgi:hypothetical protein
MFIKSAAGWLNSRYITSVFVAASPDDSTKFVLKVTFGQDAGTVNQYLAGTWDTSEEAAAALARLLRGVDPSE